MGLAAQLAAKKQHAKALASAPKQHVTLEGNESSAVASSCSPRIQTLDELIAATKVDLSVWEIERHIINKWEVAMKEESKTGRVTPVVEPLFQIKIWLKRRASATVGLQVALADIATRMTKARARPPRIKLKPLGRDNLAQIDQPDLHLGKLAWAPEAGEDYDVDIAEGCYREGIQRHAESARGFGVAKFLLTIGNDYLNVDNAAGTTTAGTAQDEDGRWQRTYTRGFNLLVWAIDYLAEIAPVDVVQVPGNHDFERGYYLAHALACWYRGHKYVAIDNSPATTKYYVWGNTLLGLTHGNLAAAKDLPLTMAIERSKDFAAAKFREFHLGHLHHQREKVFQPVLEDKGIVVRHLSSLTAADAWHASKGYRAQRASSCFIRHRERGLLAELRFNL